MHSRIFPAVVVGVRSLSPCFYVPRILSSQGHLTLPFLITRMYRRLTSDLFPFLFFQPPKFPIVFFQVHLVEMPWTPPLRQTLSPFYYLHSDLKAHCILLNSGRFPPFAPSVTNTPNVFSNSTIGPLSDFGHFAIFPFRRPFFCSPRNARLNQFLPAEMGFYRGGGPFPPFSQLISIIFFLPHFPFPENELPFFQPKRAVFSSSYPLLLFFASPPIPPPLSFPRKNKLVLPFSISPLPCRFAQIHAVDHFRMSPPLFSPHRI